MRIGLSLGSWVIVAIAVLSSIAIALLPAPSRPTLQVWVFARPHRDLYAPTIARWNATREQQAGVSLLSLPALQQRMLAGFWSGTPVADLIEAERNVAGRAFLGPLQDVGFVDLTDRLHDEGIDAQIAEASFSPWTSRGRIFGLPHDIHPVLLAYRADLVEAAGIDVSRIETWDDFARQMAPLMTDADEDGRPDRWALNLWDTSPDAIEALLLQAGGRLFDEQLRPCLTSDPNPRVVATLASWMGGPNRIAADAPEFSASGNQLKLRGFVVASLMPDWLSAVWKHDLPGLSGKLALMPLPAWEPGGRRTSVWGGTMIGIARSSEHPEAAWALAKQLYLDPAHAEALYRRGGIVTPVRRLWSLPVFDEPDPYFRGQAPGRMYLDVAPDVPRRTASPYIQLAKLQLADVVGALRRLADAEGIGDVDRLEREAGPLLAAAQRIVLRRVERNRLIEAAP